MSPDSHQHEYETTRDISIAFFLNLFFTILEIVGGLLTNSVAILSDALHDLGDSFSLGVAWYLERYSRQGPNAKYSYGYRRFSLLGAVVTSLVLITGSLFIWSEAVGRIMSPEPAHGPGMVVFAILGVAVNGFAALRLRGSTSLNARTVAWHLLEDVMGWIAVLVVGIVLTFVDLPVLDPILSILLTLYILYHVVGNLQKTLRIFLQAAPEEIDITDLVQQLVSIEGVKSEHHTHVWSLDGEHHVLTTHLVVGEATDKEQAEKIKREARSLVAQSNFEHVTIELEFGDQDHGGV